MASGIPGNFQTYPDTTNLPRTSFNIRKVLCCVPLIPSLRRLSLRPDISTAWVSGQLWLCAEIPISINMYVLRYMKTVGIKGTGGIKNKYTDLLLELTDKWQTQAENVFFEDVKF